MMKKKNILVFTLIVGLGLIVYTYSKLGITDMVRAFRNLSLQILLVYFSITFGIELLLALRWYIIVKAFNHDVPFLRIFLYRLSGYAIGYITPQAHVGGEPVRAMLLKKHNVDFKEGFGTVLVDKSMQMMTDILFALIWVIYFILHFSTDNNIAFVLVGGISVSVLFLAFYFYRMIKNKPFFSALFNIRPLRKFEKAKEQTKEVEEIIHTFYVKQFKYFFLNIVINVLAYVLMIFEYGTILRLFGYDPTLSSILILIGGVAMSYSLPVPMALGVLEFAQVKALEFLDMDRSIGLSMSLLVRAKDLIRTTVGLGVTAYFGLKISDALKKTETKDELQAVEVY